MSAEDEMNKSNDFRHRMKVGLNTRIRNTHVCPRQYPSLFTRIKPVIRAFFFIVELLNGWLQHKLRANRKGRLAILNAWRGQSINFRLVFRFWNHSSEKSILLSISTVEYQLKNSLLSFRNRRLGNLIWPIILPLCIVACIQHPSICFVPKSRRDHLPWIYHQAMVNGLFETVCYHEPLKAGHFDRGLSGP